MVTKHPVLHVIIHTQQEKLTKFILACQDSETGGFTDRPGDWVRTIYSGILVNTVELRPL